MLGDVGVPVERAVCAVDGDVVVDATLVGVSVIVAASGDIDVGAIVGDDVAMGVGVPQPHKCHTASCSPPQLDCGINP